MKIQQSFLFSLFVVLVIHSIALAHQPMWNEGSSTPLSPFVIDEVEVSKAIFGELSSENTAHFILTVPNDFNLDVSVFKGGACEDAFLPELWIMREGKQTVTPFETLSNFESQAVDGSWQAYQGHGLTGFKGAEYKETLSAGTYGITVYAPQGKGMYLLSLGGLERFGGDAAGRAAIPRFNSCS